MSVLSSIVATGMNNYSLARMQVSTMSAFGGVSDMVTIAAGAILGNEILQKFQIIGLILIVTRMIGVSYIDIRKNKLSS